MEKYYTILELPPGTNPDDVKKQYRKLAMKYHPDRNQHLPEHMRAACEERFKNINEAYNKIINKTELDEPTDEPNFHFSPEDIYDIFEFTPQDVQNINDILNAPSIFDQLFYGMQDILVHTPIFVNLPNPSPKSTPSPATGPAQPVREELHKVPDPANKSPDVHVSVKFELAEFLANAEKMIKIKIKGDLQNYPCRLNRKKYSREKIIKLSESKRSIDKYIIKPGEHTAGGINNIIIDIFCAN